MPESSTACFTIVDSTSCGSRLELTVSPTLLSPFSCSTDRPELPRPQVELLHQACVPDRDGALGGERHREFDLALRERLDVVPPERDDCHDLILTLDRYADDGSEASEPLPEALLFGVVLGIVGDVRRHHRPTLERDAADERAGAKWQFTLCDHGSVLVGAAQGAREPEVVAFVDEDLPSFGPTKPDRVLEHRLEDRLELEV